jgi:hypothetical protein
MIDVAGNIVRHLWNGVSHRKAPFAVYEVQDLYIGVKEKSGREHAQRRGKPILNRPERMVWHPIVKENESKIECSQAPRAHGFCHPYNISSEWRAAASGVHGAWVE